MLVNTLKNIKAEIPCNPPANFPFPFKFDLYMCNNNYLEVITFSFLCLSSSAPQLFSGYQPKKKNKIFLYTEAEKSKLEFNVVNTYICACGHLSLCIVVAQFFLPLKFSY